MTIFKPFGVYIREGGVVVPFTWLFSFPIPSRNTPHTL